MESPIGAITLAFHGDAVCALRFNDQPASAWALLARRFGPDVELTDASAGHPAVDALRRYFDGEIHALDSVDVDPAGTEFQLRVWRELRRIPAGRTASYAGIAARIGAPGAFRAVARANATNPIGIIVPCHRVIGADGALRGYGGGIERKAWLLAHERGAPHLTASATLDLVRA